MEAYKNNRQSFLGNPETEHYDMNVDAQETTNMAEEK